MRKIQEYRQKKGITRKQIAAYCGVNESTVLRWEKINKQVTAGVLLKLAKLFDVTVEELASDFGSEGFGKISD